MKKKVQKIKGYCFVALDGKNSKLYKTYPEALYVAKKELGVYNLIIKQINK